MHAVLVALSLLALADAPSASAAQAQDKAWSKADGGFTATLELISNEEGAAARPAEPLTLPRGARVFASVTYGGCARLESGGCDVGVRLVTTTPDGRPLGEPKEADGKVPNPKGIVQLTGKIGGVLESGDAPGVYKVRAEVTDRVAKKQLVLERDFTVVE